MTDSQSTISKPAKLASVVHRSEDALLVQTRPSKSSAGFLLIWLIGWTVGCVFLVSLVISEPSLGTFCFATPFFVSWLAVAGFLVWLLFGRESILVQNDEVLFRRTAIIELKTRHIPIAEISAVKSCRSTHTENDEHLYGIEIAGLGKPLKFGFRLSDHERLWIIQELSDVIFGHDDSTVQPAALPTEPAQFPSKPNSAFSSKRLTLADTLDHPPSDSTWNMTQLPNEVTFQRHGTLSIAAFLGTGFICLFWNGIVSVFVLVLCGLMPNDNPPQGGEWWGLFFFLIPFEVIGLGMLFAWLTTVLAPFGKTTLGIKDQTVIRQKQWPFFQISKNVNCLEVGELHLRQKESKPQTSLTSINSEQTFELSFVSADQQDLLTFDNLSQGDALWIAGQLFEFENTWTR